MAVPHSGVGLTRKRDRRLFDAELRSAHLLHALQLKHVTLILKHMDTSLLSGTAHFVSVFLAHAE